MLPRNRKIILLIVLIFACTGSSALASDGNMFIKFYQKHISAVDGNRCPMYPSCSTYASRVFKKHGPVLGWIMACDRLVRCGRDESKISLNVVVDNHEFIYDPVSANDFWWFETKPDNTRPDNAIPHEQN